MNLNIKTLLVAALTVVSLPALAQGVQRDAMRLAIEHFNPTHERDLRRDGPEFTFMMDVLKAVGEAEPQLKPAWGQASGPYYADPFLSLSARIFVPNAPSGSVPHGGQRPDPEADRQRADALKASVREIVAGCPFRRTNVVEAFDGNERVTSEITEYQLKGRETQQCTNRRVTDALVKAGLDGVRVHEENARYGSTLTVYASRGVTLWRDMAYVRSEAMKIDGAEAFIGALETTLNPQARIGVSQSVSLVKRQDAADFSDTVTLRYFRGRGDCPAGCIEKRFWTATVTPTPAGDGKYVFDVKVVEDEAAGNPSKRRAPPLVGPGALTQ